MQAGDSQALLMTRCWKAHRAWQTRNTASPSVKRSICPSYRQRCGNFRRRFSALCAKSRSTESMGTGKCPMVSCKVKRRLHPETCLPEWPLAIFVARNGYSGNILLSAPILHCVFSKRWSRYTCTKQAGRTRLSETRVAVTPWGSWLLVRQEQAQREHE